MNKVCYYWGMLNAGERYGNESTRLSSEDSKSEKIQNGSAPIHEKGFQLVKLHRLRIGDIKE